MNVFEQPESFGESIPSRNAVAQHRTNPSYQVEKGAANTVNFSSNMSSLCFDYTQKLMLSGMFADCNKDKIVSTITQTE